MKYYFVSTLGDYITEEENMKGWFADDPDAFTLKRKAVAEQKRRLKAFIAELQEILKELK